MSGNGHEFGWVSLLHWLSAMTALRALPSVVLLVAIAAGGCGSENQNRSPIGQGGSGGGGTIDAGRDAPGDMRQDATGDAADCGCVFEGDAFTLRVSWECFCAKWGCAATKPACSQGLEKRKGYASCGLVTDTLDHIGGPSISVWDSSGALVGKQIASDTTTYACPSDPSVMGNRVRAGRFPEASCEAVACTCVDGGSSCPVPDGGGLDTAAGN
jgi:hypothetical protein